MSDTPSRSIAKAVTWQLLGLVVMTAITWAVTGSVATGGAIALLGAGAGTITYVFHERLWATIRWGQDAAVPAQPSPQVPRRGHR